MFAKQKNKARFNKTSGKKKSIVPILAITTILVVALAVLSFPFVYSYQLQQEKADSDVKPFPVSVDPKNKTIIQNAEADALFTADTKPFDTVSIEIHDVVGQIASAIASLPGYSALSSTEMRFVTIYPGYRQEQIATVFAKALGWNATQKEEFLTVAKTSSSEGRFAPGTYSVNGTMSPADIVNLLTAKFNDTVLARYSDSTDAIVPLDNTLTIASLLERETSDPDEMRLISGIIWNRTWNNMNLQIDATLQYAKSSATNGKGGNWWPKIVPKDKYIKSPYNTYLNTGLPPAPIANPSVAAVIATLNPKQTDCLFYFHDKKGDFHCSTTYKEHVALLTKYYGQGK